MIRLLDRYLIRELLIPFFYCLFGFFIFWLAFDLFSDLSDFQKRHLLPTDIVEYYIVKTPEIFGLTLPITLLLALLYSLTSHARHQEITAIRAAGIGLGRIALPYMLVGLLLSLVLFALNEWWIPQSVEYSEDILERYDTNRTARASADWEMNFGFTNTRERRTWVIQGFHRETAQMARPHVEWTLGDGTRREVAAEGALWAHGVWIFTNVQEFTYPPVQGAFPFLSNYAQRVMTDFKESPEEIRIQIKLGKIVGFREARKAQLSIREILLYQKLHPEDAEKSTLLHGRLASPWTCIVVVLIAIPFGAASGRRNVFVGVAASIFICFVYFVCQQLSLAMGFSGRIPGWLAGWLPNLLFGSAGIAAATRYR